MFMGARKHHPKEFRGSAADYIKAFIDYKKHTFNLSENTIKSHIFHLYHFCTYLNNNKININKIRVPELLDYVQFMDPTKPANKHVGLNILRVFLKYLFDQLILTVDYSRIIPKDNYEDQPKLPSTFTDEEICSLLNAVDRGNPRGKRDYAILLLAIKLGLRASDICELTFENIVWERNAIVLTQKKTKKDLELPLLPEVGNAMIDYLKYGRPDTTDNHLFIHVLAPYERIHTSDLGNLVRKYFTLAKINYSNRKHGPHSLRHSFASALLREKIPLPIISETLGHSSMGVTMEYLRIDISTLKKCALEIPPIPISFYEQKGGYRHE
jgi:site-specific recombinase XerD